MIGRLRQLRVSLAAKCQIGFGAAVVLIIGSALFVPWHRIDDLMNQLNDRAAFTVAEQAKLDHVAWEEKHPETLPTTRAAAPAADATHPWSELLDYHPPRLAGPRPDAQGLSHFERRAINHFLGSPDSNMFTQTYLSTSGQSR